MSRSIVLLVVFSCPDLTEYPSSLSWT